VILQVGTLGSKTFLLLVSQSKEPSFQDSQALFAGHKNIMDPFWHKNQVTSAKR
jgi:hypothetical protein